MKQSAWILAACALLGCESSSGPRGYDFSERSSHRGSRYLPDLDEVWNFSSPADTESAFRELLPAARDSADPEYLLQLLTQIARAQGLQREYGTAHQTLDAAEDLLSSNTPVATVRYKLERGRVFNSSGSPERAKPLFLEVWEDAKRIRAHVYAVDAAHMLAIADKSAALSWNQTALDYAESSGDERALRWRGALYNNIGWTFHEDREFNKALAMFRKDFLFRCENKDDNGARVARWSVAHTLRSLGRNEEALDMQRELAIEFEQIGVVDGYVHEELGELLLLLGQEKPAKEQFGRAYDALSLDVDFATHNQARLQRIRSLGAR